MLTSALGASAEIPEVTGTLPLAAGTPIAVLAEDTALEIVAVSPVRGNIRGFTIPA